MMVPIPARPRFPPSSSTIGTAIGSVMKRGHMARPTSVGSDARRAKSAVKATETKPVEPAGRDVGARVTGRRRAYGAAEAFYLLHPSTESRLSLRSGAGTCACEDREEVLLQQAALLVQVEPERHDLRRRRGERLSQ